MAVKHLYVVHHSHTDIGYTDLQEKVIYNQCDYIRTASEIVLDSIRNPGAYTGFRWNCETYFCVEEFLKEATDQEKEDFFAAVRSGGIGLSANYLNFTDLVDIDALNDRTAEMVRMFKEYGIEVKCAMNADINGISMGARDVLIHNGVEFLFTNIHTHHGMYPLYKNQTPYFWENDEGKRLLVFSGEHYNLGNFLGLVYNPRESGSTENYFRNAALTPQALEPFEKNLSRLIADYEAEGYPYDFIVSSVSGVFSDNAPPNPEIASLINMFNEKHKDVKIEMVTLDELYAAIRDKVADAPVYRGDLTDWWAHGVGSTPYAVKHYKEAVRNYHICRNLGGKEAYPQLMREAEDNIFLYAEHTWGHSSTITNPYDTMVQNLDIRKTSYASKAHEASAKVLNRLLHKMGDQLRYYNLNGKIKAVNPTKTDASLPVEFYIEAYFPSASQYPEMTVTRDADGHVFVPQLSAHPRGVLVSFVDHFAAGEEKVYTFQSSPRQPKPVDSRHAFVGAEQVRDIVNEKYDTVSYQLPHRLENKFFRIEYDTRGGITSFYNKVLNTEMLCEGNAKFFTPLYEDTPLTEDVYSNRSHLGRNIRGVHAKLYQGRLSDIKVIDKGDVFHTVELVFELEGTYHSSVIIRMYHEIPRIDFKYKLAKTLSEDVENIFLPLTLHVPNSERYLEKGSTAMRPGIDQLPGACMEYYITDTGVAYVGGEKSILINTKDVPLVYQGEMAHHDILLCDNKPENNQRDLYSWVMNNIWETNFKMDLSGFDEYCYTLTMSDQTDAQKAVDEMNALNLGTLCFIVE